MANYNSRHTGAEIDNAVDAVLANYSGINLIGVAGAQGFGVGICPPAELPATMTPLSGTFDITNDNYGNYACVVDGSIMVWIPRFYFKIATNTITVKGIDTYSAEANANADGYAMHRAFIDEGVVKSGFFVDKYKWSLSNFVHGVSGIASSVKNSNPISSEVASNRNATNLYAGSFSDCISNSQAPTDTYGGAWAVAKSRGANFAVMSIFIADAIAKLSLAHGQASSATTYCAWYNATYNYPKGQNNSGADVDDATCTFTVCDDGYWSARNDARKNGGANVLAKTTHNGQACGITDINGNQWEVVQGLSAIATAYTIDNVTGDGTYVTIQTTAAHGLSANNWVMLTNLQTSLTNKIWKVYDVPSGTTFRIESTEGSITYTAGNATKATFYMFAEAIAIKNITGSNSSATTDQFADAFLTDAAKNNVVPIQFASGQDFGMRYGNSANQVLGFSTVRTSDEYRSCNAGLPKLNGVSSGGTNAFGKDYFYQYMRDELCPVRFGYWYSGTAAGVWFVYLGNARTNSNRYVSGRSCLYI